MTVHTVRQGESILSLSRHYGISVDRILDHADNRPFRDSGRTAGILNPGDRLTIPERELREEDAASDQRHRFRCSLGTAPLNIRFTRQDEPLADEPYVLRLDHTERTGNLDQDGWLRTTVPVNTHQALLLLGEADAQREIRLNVGDLNPNQENSGIRQRLSNLGFLAPGDEGDDSNIDAQVLRAFQAKYELDQNGELDGATRNRIIEVYGC